MRDLNFYEHIELAEKLLLIEKYYDDIQKILYHKFLSNDKVIKAFNRDIKTRLTNSTRCLLDDEYHKLIDDETFKKHGHIYYKRKNSPKFEATVNLPEKSNFIINPCMYAMQGKRIIIEPMWQDSEYQYIDFLIYYKDNSKCIVETRTTNLFNKLLINKVPFADSSMWRREWLSDFKEIV